MGVPQHFDAIIVGAGPAGSTAAYKLAEKGYNVLLIERGRVPGSKNVYGGKIYSHYIKMAYPNFEKEAPIHRWVRKERFSLISGENAVTLEYDSSKTPSFTTYLSQFTKWVASKAEQAGAVLVTEVTVEKLIKENGGVKGVVAGPDRVFGDVVIIAEGANRLVSERAKLVPQPQLREYALGIKETIKLDKKRINERFGLDDREGLSWIFLGDFLDGLPDGGFLYTFNDTVSLGIVVHLGKAWGRIDKHVSTYVEKLRLMKMFKKLLGDGQLVEYSSHLTLEDPLSAAPKRFSGKGWMIIGDAAGFLGNMGYTFRGVDFAVYSGLKAAEAFEKNRDEDPLYFDRMIRETPMYRELYRYRNVHKIMENPRLFSLYPKLVNEVFSRKLDIREETPLALTLLVNILLDYWKKGDLDPTTLLKDVVGVVMRI